MKNGLRISGVVLGLTLGLACPGATTGAEEPAANAGQPVEGFTPIPVIQGVKSLEAGIVAPVFTVKDLEGKVFDFGAVRGSRAHLLVFWSIFCEPCREEMPVIERITNEYKVGDRLEVIAVNMDGEPFLDGIRGFVRQYKYSFRVVLDELDAKGESFAIADPYQVAGTPVLYLVNAEGKIAGSHLGRIGEADLKALITAMFEAK